MYAVIFVLWIVLNGRLTPEIVLLDLVFTVAAGFVLNLAFDFRPKTELLLWKMLPLLILYALTLFKEIIKANLTVLWAVLNPRRPLVQSLVTFDIDLNHSFTRYLLANSITLTPGTITVDITGNRYTVHCLSREMISGIETGVFMKQLKRMEKLYD